MDLQQVSKKGAVSLLTLPKSDFFDAACMKVGTNDATIATSSSLAGDKIIITTNNSRDISTSSSSKNDGGRLILLQLPSGWSPSDLKNCHFVGPAQNCRDYDNNISSKDTTTTVAGNHASAATAKMKKITSNRGDNHHQQQQQQQVALVSEDKRMSFAVHRVETSNALILIPPSTDTTAFSEQKEENDDQDKHLPSPHKKLKTMPLTTTKNASHLLPLAARLLKKGGSGASFLELRRKQLSMPQLLNVLLCSKPTSSSTGSGYTVEQLAHHLQASTAEIRKALRHLGAFRIPDTIPSAYTILPHETKLECIYGILSTLLEVDEHSDYAGAGITVEALVRHAQERIQPTEQLYEDDDDTESRNVLFPAHSSAVIRHCLESLSASCSSSPPTTTGDRMRLDVQKVAAWVARRIFQMQSQPWEETLFLSRWQAELPGVGDLYQVNLDMLRGVAIRLLAEQQPPPLSAAAGGEADASLERFWKFVPVESLPLDPVLGFPLLFQHKEKWVLDELAPYLDQWTSHEDDASHDKLLLRFTKIVIEERDGVVIKFYSPL